MRHAAVVPYFSAALAVGAVVTACNKSTTTGTVFVVSGTAAVGDSGDRLAGTVTGQLYVFDTANLLAPVTPIAGSYSAKHQFVLSR